MANSRKPRSASERPGTERTRRGAASGIGLPARRLAPHARGAAAAALGAGDGESMREIVDAVKQALSAAGIDGDAIAVAYSGGVDSTVLLAAVVQAVGASRCVALHIHHGLSPNADAWLAHARHSADAFAVAFAARRVSVKAANLGIEQAAREARYAALHALCAEHGAAALLLGHHADDQAETLLLQMLRGAGLPGIAAMPRGHQQRGRLAMLRPLLDVPRSLIEAAASEAGLAWIDDESNDDVRFARNALRQQVMPALERSFPGYRTALARTARHAAAAQALIDDLGAEDLLRCAAPAADRDNAAARSAEPTLPHALSAVALNALGEARAANAMRRWIRALGMPAPSTVKLAQMLRQLREAGAPSAVRIHHAGHVLRLYRGRAYWEPAAYSSTNVSSNDQNDRNHQRVEQTLAAPIVGDLHTGAAVWRLPAWRGALLFRPTADPMAADAVSVALLRAAPLTARSRRGGERMQVAAGAPRRTLKNLFQEAGVPPWHRHVPLIFSGERLLFAPGLGLDRSVQAPPSPEDTVNGVAFVQLVWQPDTRASDPAEQ